MTPGGGRLSSPPSSHPSARSVQRALVTLDQLRHWGSYANDPLVSSPPMWPCGHGGSPGCSRQRTRPGPFASVSWSLTEMLVGPEVRRSTAASSRAFRSPSSGRRTARSPSPLGVQDPGRKAEERVNVALVKELPPNGLARATLEEHVVGDDDGGAAVDLQDDVLDEVQLLVGGGRPELVADDNQRLPLRFPSSFTTSTDESRASAGRRGACYRSRLPPANPEYARGAVDALTRRERCTNLAKQPGIFLDPVRDRMREPLVVSVRTTPSTRQSACTLYLSRLASPATTTRMLRSCPPNPGNSTKK